MMTFPKGAIRQLLRARSDSDFSDSDTPYLLRLTSGGFSINATQSHQTTPETKVQAHLNDVIIAAKSALNEAEEQRKRAAEALAAAERRFLAD